MLPFFLLKILNKLKEIAQTKRRNKLYNRYISGYGYINWQEMNEDDIKLIDITF